MNKKIVSILLALSLIGVALSGLLVYEHHTLATKGFEQKSFCSINEFIDCDVVNASSYADFHSIPIAGLGLLFYLLLAGYCFAALLGSPDRKSGLAFLFFLNAGGLVITIIMAYLSFMVLGVLCLLCAGLYLVNALITLLFPAALGFRWSQILEFSKNYLSSLAGKENPPVGFKPRLWLHLVITLIVFGVGCALLIPEQKGKKKNDAENKARFFNTYLAQAPAVIDTTDRPLWGNPNAPVKIVEFSDFQCPFCRVAAKNIKPSLAEVRQDVAFYFYHFPLDSTCNPTMTRPMHPHACHAAMAAVCAEKQGKFWEMHDMLFANQKTLDPENVKTYAQILKLNADTFENCMKDPETVKRIQQDIEVAKSLEVSGTPSVFINGRRFGPWSNRNILREVVRKEKEMVKKDPAQGKSN